MRWYSQDQVDRIIAAARTFVEASIAGKGSVTVDKVTHEPKIGGRCAQFVREVCEAGLNLVEGGCPWKAGSANEMAGHLRSLGYSVGDTGALRPGDILWRPGGPYGHIAMYVGTDVPGHEGIEIIAENTSVRDRGVPRRPGTKYTRRGMYEGEFGRWREVFRLTKPEVD